ncbi:MATE family efflux transporter [Oscillospiraceae bacterium]|nr:MATE family efflux transporter [Oscillospiraceae bacterium]
MPQAENPMGTKPVFPLLMGMAIPPIISMLIQSLYNVVDSVFVARLSQDALTAVSLAYPLQNLVLAVAVGYGVGANAFIARSLGEGNRQAVDRAAGMGLVFTGLHSLAFLLVGLFGAAPFLRLFNQDAGVLAMSESYTRIVICLAFGSLFHIYIEKLFQAVGNMVVPMILQGVGAIVNIALDPVLIFGLLGLPALGVTGAAIATIIGQMTACTLAVIYFIRTDTGIHIRLSGLRPQAAIAKKIYAVGVPSCMMAAMPSLLVGALNALLATLHSQAVAVFGIYFKLQTFVYMPANGLVQGMRPIVSYNYGAGKAQRMRATLKDSLLVTAGIMVLGTVLFWALPVPIMQLFGADAGMMALGVPMLRIASLGFLASTLGTVLAGGFEALGKGMDSLLITLIRQLLVIPPLAVCLSRVWGLAGVWAAFPVAEGLAALVAVLLFRRTLRRLQAPGGGVKA